MRDEQFLTEIEANMRNFPYVELSKSRVMEWMKSQDIEIQGALFSLFSKEECLSRITPRFSFQEIHNFNLKYLRVVLQENPQGEWSGNRSEAGWSLVALFKWFWDSKDISRTALADIKRLLEELYRTGDEALRCCIITTILEHLFENENVIGYFSDWNEDPVLEKAYTEAVGYSRDIIAYRKANDLPDPFRRTGSGDSS